jgi:hypothetical protein
MKAKGKAETQTNLIATIQTSNGMPALAAAKTKEAKSNGRPDQTVATTQFQVLHAATIRSNLPVHAGLDARRKTWTTWIPATRQDAEAVLTAKADTTRQAVTATAACNQNMSQPKAVHRIAFFYALK